MAGDEPFDESTMVDDDHPEPARPEPVPAR
jgi:hypothetical protein